MHVAFVGARGVPHGYSSTEQLALNVGKRLVARGHEFTVYCRSNQFEDHSPVFEGINRVFLPTVEHRVFGQVIHGFLAGCHATMRAYDIVHVQLLTNVYQSILPWLVRRNVVVNVDGEEWDNPKWPRPVRHAFFRSTVRATLLMCPEFITDAKGMYELYRERYGRESTMIGYGAEVIEPRRPELLGEYDLEPGRYFFVAARLVPSKQLHTIVDAFTAADPTRVLAIAGGGDYGSDYVRKIKERAGPKVRFLGMVSDQSLLDELYANAYAYIHGAALGGINSALLRPLGAGAPALSADTPVNREVLERADGSYCGRLWRTPEQLVDAITRCDQDEDLVASLAERSVHQIRERFSWDMVADQYETYYRGITEKWPPAEIRRRVHEEGEKYLQPAPGGS